MDPSTGVRVVSYLIRHPPPVGLTLIGGLGEKLGDETSVEATTTTSDLGSRNKEGTVEEKRRGGVQDFRIGTPDFYLDEGTESRNRQGEIVTKTG